MGFDSYLVRRYKNNKKPLLDWLKRVVAGAVGIEPTLKALETLVLPLYDAPEAKPTLF